MALDVHHIFEEIVRTHGGKTETQAKEFIKTMSSKKRPVLPHCSQHSPPHRYQTDTWS